jgi:tRNA1(Val) A37 N6-methylase TrmN6
MRSPDPDLFLGGRVRAAQPISGFRSGLDAVMLAAAVPARPGETVLELGAGAGVASLCLMARVPGLRLAGVERNADLVRLAEENAAAGGTDAAFVCADIFALPPALKRDFDQVFCNPPFHGPVGPSSPDPVRAASLADGGMLRDWLRIGLQRTVSSGFFTTIIRADRLHEALAALPDGGLTTFPLWPRAGAAAKRVILRVAKGARTPPVLAAGLVLHGPDGRFTPEAEAVLRRGEPLALPGGHL